MLKSRSRRNNRGTIIILRNYSFWFFFLRNKCNRKRKYLLKWGELKSQERLDSLNRHFKNENERSDIPGRRIKSCDYEVVQRGEEVGRGGHMYT